MKVDNQALGDETKTAKRMCWQRHVRTLPASLKSINSWVIHELFNFVTSKLLQMILKYLKECGGVGILVKLVIQVRCNILDNFLAYNFCRNCVGPVLSSV